MKQAYGNSSKKDDIAYKVELTSVGIHKFAINCKVDMPLNKRNQTKETSHKLQRASQSSI